MATLKQHQAAMVNLLANGTSIPTSAVRLAHALHDVLSHINGAENAPEAHTERRSDTTTSGLNDAMLAADVQALRKPRGKIRSENEQKILQLENTIRQLRESNLKLRQEVGEVRSDLELSLATIRRLSTPEQAGCRKEDTQCEHAWRDTGRELYCKHCGVHPSDLEEPK